MKKTNEQMVAEYQSTKSEAVLDALIKANMGLLHTWVERGLQVIPNNPEYEDLMQEVLAFPLMNTIKDYKADTGVKFISLLKVYVNKYIGFKCRNESLKKRCPTELPDSLDRLQEINKDGEIDDRNFSVECKDYRSAEFKDLIERIEWTEKERIVVNILISGGDNEACSKRLGCTSSNITYYKNKIGKKLILAGYAF